MPLPLLAAPAAAAAAVPTPTGETSEVTELSVPHEKRSGVAVGLTFGEGVVAASGYPNNALEIGQPAYHSATGPMAGLSTTLLVMGALADSLNVGLWFSHAVARGSDWQSEANAGGLRVEAFPFIRLAPHVEGLGFLAQFGVGGGHLTPSGATSSSSSGTQSFVGAGVFYEWRIVGALGGHFGAGPALEYDAIWSQPFERQGLLACARVVFYGGR
jgi:hypothetical protein